MYILFFMYIVYGHKREVSALPIFSLRYIHPILINKTIYLLIKAEKRIYGNSFCKILWS